MGNRVGLDASGVLVRVVCLFTFPRSEADARKKRHCGRFCGGQSAAGAGPGGAGGAGGAEAGTAAGAEAGTASGCARANCECALSRFLQQAGVPHGEVLSFCFERFDEAHGARAHCFMVPWKDVPAAIARAAPLLAAGGGGAGGGAGDGAAAIVAGAACAGGAAGAGGAGGATIAGAASAARGGDASCAAIQLTGSRAVEVAALLASAMAGAGAAPPPPPRLHREIICMQEAIEFLRCEVPGAFFQFAPCGRRLNVGASPETERGQRAAEPLAPAAVAKDAFYPFILVNLKSGVSFHCVQAPPLATERVGGSTIGGATLMGLMSVLRRGPPVTPRETFLLAQQGDNGKVDMLVRDIYGGGYAGINLSGDTIASTAGKLQTSRIEKIQNTSPLTIAAAKDVLTPPDLVHAGAGGRAGRPGRRCGTPLCCCCGRQALLGAGSPDPAASRTPPAASNSPAGAGGAPAPATAAAPGGGSGAARPEPQPAAGEQPPSPATANNSQWAAAGRGTLGTPPESAEDGSDLALPCSDGAGGGSETPAAPASEADLARSLLTMTSYNVAQQAYFNARLHSCRRLMLVGYFLDMPGYLSTIQDCVDFWSGGECNTTFVRLGSFLGALGAIFRAGRGDAYGGTVEPLAQKEQVEPLGEQGEPLGERGEPLGERVQPLEEQASPPPTLGAVDVA